MSNNKKAKEKLIELYGAECFIEKLHLRQDDKPRHYTGKAQLKRMKQLTYHHIQERRNGGKATVENGALLSVENHIWFNKQSPKVQARLNKAFQRYKECQVVFSDDIELRTEVAAVELRIEEKEQKKSYNRAKQKRENRRLAEEYLYEDR